MSRTTDVGWVAPPKPIRGLDHLGVQGPCIALYGQLLPGITNVTDRARYYSFYPWLIRSFEQRYRNHSVDEFRRVLRRAECLFALIAIRHARVASNHEDWFHGLGMVGRLALLRIPENAKSFNLEEHASQDGSQRYFQNPLGGLGQYYFGPLRDLQILDYASEEAGALPGYDKVRGNALADAFGAAVPESDFFRLLEKDEIRWSALDPLDGFCPCALQKSEPERSLLLDLFLSRSKAYQTSDGAIRRASLALILDLLTRISPVSGYNAENVFRAATYSGALPDETAWEPAGSLKAAQRGWAAYQRNELFSIALQGLFSATLWAIELNHSGKLASASAAGEVCAALLSSKSQFRKLRLADVVSELKSTLPSIEHWQHEVHEMRRGWRILKAGGDHTDLESLVNESVQLLLSLVARGVDPNPYGEFDFDPDHFGAQELHLLSLARAWETIWPDLTIEEWVQWLSVQWGVRRHLSVALRKLRAEQRDTFRIRPLEHELRVVEVPPPTPTIPRLGKAFQILRDLGLTSPDDDGWPQVTPEGKKQLEVCLAV